MEGVRSASKRQERSENHLNLRSSIQIANPSHRHEEEADELLNPAAAFLMPTPHSERAVMTKLAALALLGANFEVMTRRG